ncbi:SGNH/GDSL hydrolase family protein [Dyadobacter psychrotolerans]|uniref:SGNH/GDSL hydrolase family protein n=1 Tax=Dyadobacter psychrotolerans TaxID=2541721 RepID=A0A4R5DS57_9BACT|nr:SGNH/GDSL hydrolase family protein [Dyadobacter psychrotolerans]
MTTTLLSSCNVVDDIFPNRGKSDRDQTLAFFGDSLTVGAGGTASYATLVAAEFQDRTVATDGIIGQLASSIAVRQGGLPLKITVEGNKLNGIQPIRITKLSNMFLSTGSNYNEYSRTGTIGGVRCTIKRTANAQGETYTITPGTVSVIDIAADSVFLLDDASRLRTATQILWYGRNNVRMANGEQEILSSLESSIAYITTPARYIVVGVLLASGEIKGNADFNKVAAINASLSAKYGKSFVEMTPPTDAEMTAIGYTPTANDKIDLQNQNFPRGLRADGGDDIHLNDKGYHIVANRVIAKIKELKY